jgi:hypothetical protein
MLNLHEAESMCTQNSEQVKRPERNQQDLKRQKMIWKATEVNEQLFNTST